MHPQPETYWGNVNPIGPRGVYDEAKRYAEALTMAYHNQQGVNTAIARIFNTYGPRMRRNDGRATVTFLHQALEGKPLTVFGDGSQTRSLCYVDDLIRGLYLLAMSDEHLPVNIGNPDHEVTMLELAETCIRVTGSSSEIVFEALPIDDPRERRPDITRARQILGWEPEVDLDEGLRRWVRVARARAGRGLDAAPGRRSLAVARRGARSPRRAQPARRARATCRSGSSTSRSSLYGADARRPSRSYEKLHVQVARLDALLGRPARRREARGRRTPANPDDPAYDWTTYDAIVAAARSGGHRRRSSRSSARPSWANGGRGSNVAPRERAPTCGRSPTRPRSATAARYVERRRRTLPAVRDWLAWNEPNNPVFLKPQYRRVGARWVIASAQAYAEDLQRDLQRRPRDRHRRASASPAARPRRAATTTRRAARPSVSPLAFLRAVKTRRA